MDLGHPGNQLHSISSEAENKKLLEQQPATSERTREKEWIGSKRQCLPLTIAILPLCFQLMGRGTTQGASTGQRWSCSFLNFSKADIQRWYFPPATKWMDRSDQQRGKHSCFHHLYLNKKNLVDLSVSRDKQTKIKILAFSLEQLVILLRNSRLFIGKLLGYRIKLTADIAKCNWISRTVLRLYTGSRTCLLLHGFSSPSWVAILLSAIYASIWTKVGAQYIP